jgi:hypothetical protein
MDWMTMDLVGYPIHFHPPESKILDIHFTELDISIPGSSWCIQNNIFTDRGQGPPSLPDPYGLRAACIWWLVTRSTKISLYETCIR